MKAFDRTGTWEYESRHGGKLPDGTDHAPELEKITNALVAAANVNKDVLTIVPNSLVLYVLYDLLLFWCSSLCVQNGVNNCTA
jgi:hypothetical protein